MDRFLKGARLDFLLTPAPCRGLGDPGRAPPIAPFPLAVDTYAVDGTLDRSSKPLIAKRIAPLKCLPDIGNDLAVEPIATQLAVGGLARQVVLTKPDIDGVGGQEGKGPGTIFC